MRKSSAPVLRAGAGVDAAILNIGEIPALEPAVLKRPDNKENYQDKNKDFAVLKLQQRITVN